MRLMRDPRDRDVVLDLNCHLIPCCPSQVVHIAASDGPSTVTTAQVRERPYLCDKDARNAPLSALTGSRPLCASGTDR